MIACVYIPICTRYTRRSLHYTRGAGNVLGKGSCSGDGGTSDGDAATFDKSLVTGCVYHGVDVRKRIIWNPGLNRFFLV